MRALWRARPGQPLTMGWFHSQALTSWVEDRAARRRYDAVFAYSSAMAPLALALPPGPRRVLDLVDVDSEKWLAYAAAAALPQRAVWAREARTLLAFERRAAAAFDHTVLVSAEEARRFIELAPEVASRIDHVDNGVDLQRFDPALPYPGPYAGQGPALVFTGTMDYRPNVEAVSWFARQVMPELLRDGWPGGAPQFHIVGARPSAAVQALAALPGVHVTGRVADTRPYIAHAAIAVAPLGIAAASRTRCWRRWRWPVPSSPPRRPSRGCGRNPAATCWWRKVRPAGWRRSAPSCRAGTPGWARRRGSPCSGATTGRSPWPGSTPCWPVRTCIPSGRPWLEAGRLAARAPATGRRAGGAGGGIPCGDRRRDPHLERLGRLQSRLAGAPIAGWLGWVRRARLAGLRPEPTLWPAPVALGLGVAWLAAERLGIMEGRQLAALGILLAWVVAVLGLRFARAMSAPLAYLVFLVPFGGFLVPVLQRLTAAMIVFGLEVLQIPHYVDQLIIEIPAGVFLVAEACAGLRFVIASMAFGALYALVMFRSPGRRAVVMLLAVVVPVLANGLRALGTVLLGHWMGSAQAAAADHLIYGWGFFALVLALLILAGLPFRQDGEPGAFAALPGAAAVRPGTPAVVAVTLAAGLSAPLLMLAWQGEIRPPERQAFALPPPAGCVPSAPDGDLRCGGAVIQARLLRFPPAVSWSAVVAERGRLAGLDDEATVFSLRDGEVVWQGRQGIAGTVLTTSWLNGGAVGDGLHSRLAQARTSLFGGAGPVLAVVILSRAGGGAVTAALAQRERDLLQEALRLSAGGPAMRAARWSLLRG